MSRSLEDLVREAAPHTDDEVRGLALDGEAELLRGITAQDRPAPRRRGLLPRRAPRLTRPRLLAWSVAGAAAVAAFALLGVSLTRDGELRTGPDRVWAASALRVADAVPRLAIGLDGWHVTRADQFTVGEGEMTFAGPDGRTVDLTWRPERFHRSYVEDRRADAAEEPTAAVVGTRAEVFRYPGAAGDVGDPGAIGDFAALWRSGGYTLELRSGTLPDGRRLTREEFVEVLGALKLVSVDDWLAAMPASVVVPADREQVVREMLRDVPLPEGFDAAGLADDEQVNDRYQLGAKVSGAVACAWFERWTDARDSGEERAERAAEQALLSSRDWPVLHEMNADGDYPEVLWEYAEAAAGDGTVMGGRTLTVEESVDAALGCESR